VSAWRWLSDPKRIGEIRVDQGAISFIVLKRIAPLLNIDLESEVRGIQISSRVPDRMNRPNLTYRSAPPASVSQTGHANVTDPDFAPQRPARQDRTAGRAIQIERFHGGAIGTQTVPRPPNSAPAADQ
jgi:hypothetical protein